MSVMDLPAEERPEEAGGTYVRPEETTVEELQKKAAAEDPSLAKYADALLGEGGVEVEPDNPLNLVFRSMEIVPDGRDPIVMRPDEEAECVLKEGAEYSVWVTFHVQRNLVFGVKYVNVVKRALVTVSKDQDMIGSYAPRAEVYRLKISEDEAPTGMMSRGGYKGVLRIMDDDLNVFAELPYKLQIKKEWA